MRKKPSVKPKRTSKTKLPQLPPKNPQPETVVSKYPLGEEKTEEKEMSTFKKDDRDKDKLASASSSGSSSGRDSESSSSGGGSASKSSSSKQESPGEKQRREQDEAEKSGEVHSAITIDDEGKPEQKHTAGA